jgi:hypothetical protein
MKKSIVFILFAFTYLVSNAQCDLPYKPLSAFGTDTTAFITYNFKERRECYEGKTLKDVIKDLGMPVKYYTPINLRRGSLFSGIYIYIYDRVTASRLRDSNKEDNAIDIYWEKEINVLHQEYKRLTGADWDEAYEYLKDMRIKELDRFSKYFKKSMETKSYDPNRRKEGDW